MNPLDNATALWVFVSLVCVVVAFALGYLLGHSDGVRFGLTSRALIEAIALERHRDELADRDGDDGITFA